MGTETKPQENVRDIADKKLEAEKAEQVKGGRMKADPKK